MLLDFELKEEFKNEMEGVIHANKTARIQTEAMKLTILLYFYFSLTYMRITKFWD
jgi:predicted NodU family carbamoyl transferase